MKSQNKFKTELTIEQSARLIELGVDPKLASTICLDFNGTYAYVSGDEKYTVRDCVNGEYYTQEPTIITLSDLLSILPKEILLGNRLYCNLKIQYIYEEWAVNYSPHAMSIFRAPELIDSLYQLLIWCLEQGYCKCGKGGGR